MMSAARRRAVGLLDLRAIALGPFRGSVGLFEDALERAA